MVGVFIAKGFEEIEALTVVDLLRRGNIPVETVSITEEKSITGAHGITVCADTTIDKFDFSTCDMIVLPGGMPGTTNLQKCNLLCDHVDAFVKGGKWVAAICAAPMILGEKGLLKGKKATIYPGMENHLLGANHTKDGVAVDGNIITGRGPGKAMEFALTIVEKLLSIDERIEMERDLVL